MIYFDNAATGGYKPNSVIETTLSVIKYLNANPGRSGHRLSLRAGDFVYLARKKLCKFFNNDSLNKVIFTKNCTEGLNMAIHGLLNENDKVITTCFEHNSVLRPLNYEKTHKNIDLTIIEPKTNTVTLEDVEKVYTKDTKLLIVTSASNVTGSMPEIEKIGNFLKGTNTIFMVDGAQGCGHIKIDMQKMNINVLSVAGHKGLYAIGGSGAVIINGNVNINSYMQGGTGTESFNPNQPDCYPEKLESGTLNLPAICSLEEGVSYVENNLEYIGETLTKTTDYLINQLSSINGIKIYSQKNPVGIVAFSVLGVGSQEFSEILSSSYDIAVRGGFHCSPLMHKFLKTSDDGLVRVSLSPFNTKKEINFFINACKEIINS